jgi:cytochrome c biogenesis protein
MTETARSRSLAAQDPLDDLDGELALPVVDVFDRLWHVLISMRTGLALILALAVMTLLGTVIDQAPAGIQNDPQTYATWLDSARIRYGGWTNVLDVLGLFQVFGSLWFKGTMLLLTTSILACSINRTPLLWRQAVHPRLRVSDGLYEHATLTGHVSLERGSVEDGRARVEAALRRRHFRAIATPDDQAISIYADRFRWGPFGTVIAHVSLVLILGGALLGTTGFRNTDFAVAVGSTVPVGNGTDLSVEATSFHDSYYDDGSPADYSSHLVLYASGQQVADQTIRVNEPLHYGDVTFYQSFFGPAVDLQVTGSDGTSLFDQGVPMPWGSTDGTKVIGEFQLTDQALTGYVIGVASGETDAQIKPGQIQLEVYRDSDPNTPVAIQVIDQGTPTALTGIDGLQFTFQREREFTGLIVARDPGAPLVWLGALLLVFGVALVFFFPSRRLWARIRPAARGSVIQVAAVSRHDVMFESAFRELVDELRPEPDSSTAR